MYGYGGVERDDGAVGEAGAFAEGGRCCEMQKRNQQRSVDTTSVLGEGMWGEEKMGLGWKAYRLRGW